jgi:hypothetical protein
LVSIETELGPIPSGSKVQNSVHVRKTLVYRSQATHVMQIRIIEFARGTLKELEAVACAGTLVAVTSQRQIRVTGHLVFYGNRNRALGDNILQRLHQLQYEFMRSFPHSRFCLRLVQRLSAPKAD